eukprot:UN08493
MPISTLIIHPLSGIILSTKRTLINNILPCTALRFPISPCNYCVLMPICNIRITCNRIS